jgi:hypothetical protein
MKRPPDRSRLKLTVLAGAILIALILDAFVLTLDFTAFVEPSAFQMLLIWSVGWLTATGLVAFFIFQLLKYQKPLLAQAVCLIAVAVNLILIFSICPMDLLHQPKGILPLSPAAATLVMAEHQKAVEEIKNRDSEEDSWFHNKFILVGGLLAATMGYIGFGGSQTSQESPGERLTALSKSPSTAVILALATVLALGVDMHVRGNACEIDQLGIWIKNYVEPALLHPVSGKSQEAEDFKGWEEFLRIAVSLPRPPVYWDTSSGVGGGLHNDELQNLLYEPHIHFLTVLVYILYLGVFQTFARPRGTGLTSDARVMLIICFVVVQASFFAFAWIAHSAPEMFELKVLPFLPAYEFGYLVPLHYFVPCLALVILNIPYLCLLSPKWSESSHEQAANDAALSHPSS